jgi:anti-sigma factor RsiW
MDCKECTDQLTAFLDAELSAQETEQIRSHLSACKSCADEWLSLRDSKEFIESHVHDLEPSPEAWNMVRARISVKPTAHPPSHFFAPNRWHVAVATLALVAATGLGYFQYQQIQKRAALDKYISQYIQERQAQRPVRPVLADTQSGADSDEANPFADNPFLEIKATASDNPFRSEDR